MELACKQRFYGPYGLFILAICLNLATIMAIDMFVPALPEMQQEFHVSEAYLNLTLFSFTIGSAISTLFSGAISDRVGRKPMLLGSMILFVVASVGCVYSTCVEMLIPFRIAQSLSYGAIFVISTALIKDAYEGESLKVAMACMQSLIIIGPVVSPFLGALMIVVWDWHAIFWLLAILSAITIPAILLMDETLDLSHKGGESFGDAMRKMGSDMGALAKDKRFMSLALLMSTSSIPYFAFIATASYIVMVQFAAGYLNYSFCYAAVSLVSVAAPYVFLVLSKRLPHKTILVMAIGLIGVGALLLGVMGEFNWITFTIAMAPAIISEGIIRTSAFMVLLDQPADRVGSASSLSNFCYSMCTALGTVFGTLAIWPNFVVGICVITALSAVVMAGLYAFGVRGRG